MDARNARLLILIFFVAALAPAAPWRVAQAVRGPDEVAGHAPTIQGAGSLLPGSRCTHLPDEQLPPRCSKNNRAPVASSFKASKSLVSSPADCPAGTGAACAEGGMTVELSAEVSDPDGDALAYTYTTTGGRIRGEGANVTWDLTGLIPGTYTATVEYDDRCGCIGFSSVTVTVDKCSCESDAAWRRFAR